MEPSDTASRTQEALRIQVSAVAAQQTKLLEDEFRVEGRQLALQRQEEQVGIHLQEKRARIARLRLRLQKRRHVLQKQAAGQRQREEEAARELERDREEIKACLAEAKLERNRCIELRRRLKQRWRRQWNGQLAALQDREQNLANERVSLNAALARLNDNKALLARVRLHANAESELARRQLRERQADLNSREQELRGRAEAVCERERRLADAERGLFFEQKQWQERRVDLEREAEGLEQRIYNLRLKLRESPLPADPEPAEVQQHSTVTHQPTAAADIERLHFFKELAAGLADQRLYLTEQCERLLGAQQRWRHESERQSRLLQERQSAVATGERSLAEEQARLHSQRREMESLRCALQARVIDESSRQESLARQREEGLERVRDCEERVENERLALRGLRERWLARRRREMNRLLLERSACEELRRECASLREEWFRRCQAAHQAQKFAAARALALEQYRLALIGQAPNAAAAEKRLRRLQRRVSGLQTAAEETLALHRQALQKEAEQLEERARWFEVQMAQHAQQEAELADRVSAWEKEQAREEVLSAEVRQQIEFFQDQHERDERQLKLLRDDVDHLVRLLMEGTERPLAERAA